MDFSKFGMRRSLADVMTCKIFGNRFKGFDSVGVVVKTRPSQCVEVSQCCFNDIVNECGL